MIYVETSMTTMPDRCEDCQYFAWSRWGRVFCDQLQGSILLNNDQEKLVECPLRERHLIAEEYAHSNNCDIVSNEFLKDF